jgi:hypothetical protein
MRSSAGGVRSIDALLVVIEARRAGGDRGLGGFEVPGE